VFRILIGLFAIGLIVGVVIMVAKSARERSNLTKADATQTLVEQAVEGPAALAESPNTTIVFTGDVMLGRHVEIVSMDEHSSSVYPFLNVAEKLKDADLTIVNLENPIIESCPRHDGGFKFCANPYMLDGLKFAGVDIVSLANNHTYNYGTDGFNQTIRHVKTAGIGAIGINREVLIKEINDTKFGFLGFDFVTNAPTKVDFDAVKQADTLVDVLVVGVHWGAEYQDKPQPIVREWGGKLLENGADVIWGHHPHWVQPVEKIQGKIVMWSLGNFVFDQGWSEETKKGLAVKLTFDGSNVESVEEMPVYMRETAQPVFVE
jgi:poly-gamma-glutamate capsule biosynthesis protein CapA/YwtB (metallophosphatase superfamily)